MSKRYLVTIGLEVHVHLDTETKLFCGCINTTGGEPNTRICPVCTGQPGTLPVMNIRAAEQAVRAAAILDCRINPRSVFARKQYFYPDMPKNYQISQYELPIAETGRLGSVGITRVHLEEDAGKLIHSGSVSLVDLNRASSPLIEIVSEPDIKTPSEAAEYLKSLRQLLRYAGVSDCDMEKGSMRCDANISLREREEDPLGVKVEIKNMNSFRSVERALEFEILRQKEILSSGGSVEQETRLWDDNLNLTRGMRSKEEANDYRYFPDPDLPPLIIEESFISGALKDLPELPRARKKRFMEEYSLSEYDALILTQEKETADYFETALKSSGIKDAKLLSGWVTVELAGKINASQESFSGIPVKAEHLGELVSEIENGRISGKMAKDIFPDMFGTGRSAKDIIEEKGLKQINSEDAILELCRNAVSDNPALVEKFLSGKEGVIGALVGQVMKESRGQANPKLVNETLRRIISGE